MEMLKHVFLEQPLLIYVLAAVAEFTTVAIWYSTRARWTRIMFLVWPLLAVGVGLLAWAVETDREKVQHCWERIEAGFDARSARQVMENIADDFQSDRLDKGGLAALAEFSLPVLKQDEAQITKFTIEEVSGGSARTTVGVLYRGLVQPFYSEWEVLFAPQRDGQWRVNRAKCTQPSAFTLKQAGSELRRVKKM